MNEYNNGFKDGYKEGYKKALLKIVDINRELVNELKKLWGDNLRECDCGIRKYHHSEYHKNFYTREIEKVEFYKCTKCGEITPSNPESFKIYYKEGE